MPEGYRDNPVLLALQDMRAELQSRDAQVDERLKKHSIRVGELEKKDARNQGIGIAARVLGGVALMVLSGTSGWLWTRFVDHDQTLARVSSKLVTIEASEMTSERRHEQLRDRVRATEGNLRELTPAIVNLTARTSELAEEVEHLRRRRR